MIEIKSESGSSYYVRKEDVVSIEKERGGNKGRVICKELDQKITYSSVVNITDILSNFK